MSEYPIRLTKWLPREDLLSIIKDLNRHKEAFKIKESTVWKNGRKVKGFAVCIKERRQKERRTLPKIENIDLNMTLDEFILLFMGHKKEGISIFSTVLNGKFYR